MKRKQENTSNYIGVGESSRAKANDKEYGYDGKNVTNITNVVYEDFGVNAESGGMANEDDCLFCALKHVSTAYALWNEFQGNEDYKLEFVMSLGELRAAELHLVQNYPEWCVAVRELRLGIEAGGHLFKEFRDLMRGLADTSGIFNSAAEEGPKAG